MKEKENMDYEREEIFSKVVRAGKRTYFFDVRQNRSNEDYYMVLTESIKRYNEDGTHFYQKHKIFLYTEDFGKFADGLSESVRAIIDLKNQKNVNMEDDVTQKFTDIEFDDLVDISEQTSESDTEKQTEE